MSRLSIPNDWRVPEQFARRLGDAVGRQRVMAADGHLLLVLHEPPTAGVPERVGRLLWRDPTGAWKARPFGDGVQALKRHVSECAERVDRLESAWQAAVSADDYFTLLREIAPLHRTVRNLHSTLQEARELAPDDRDLINQRDRVGEIERALELLHGDAKNGLDYTVAHQAEQQAQRAYDMAVSAHRLNLLAAIFFPVATLSAIFGMNLVHGLERGSTPIPFWLIVLLGLGSGMVLAQAIARKPTPVTRPSAKEPARRR